MSGSGNGSGPRPLATGPRVASAESGPLNGVIRSSADPYPPRVRYDPDAVPRAKPLDRFTLKGPSPYGTVYFGGPESIDPQGYTDKLPADLAELEAHVEQIHDADCSLLVSKHVDYGKSNIADAPGGAYNGLIVRLHDKFSRLKHLHETGANPQNESVKDTLRDIRNYCTIAEMVIDGTWPK